MWLQLYPTFDDYGYDHPTFDDYGCGNGENTVGSQLRATLHGMGNGENAVGLQLHATFFDFDYGSGENTVGLQLRATLYGSGKGENAIGWRLRATFFDFDYGSEENTVGLQLRATLYGSSKGENAIGWRLRATFFDFDYGSGENTVGLQLRAKLYGMGNGEIAIGWRLRATFFDFDYGSGENTVGLQLRATLYGSGKGKNAVGWLLHATLDGIGNRENAVKRQLRGTLEGAGAENTAGLQLHATFGDLSFSNSLALQSGKLQQPCIGSMTVAGIYVVAPVQLIYGLEKPDCCDTTLMVQVKPDGTCYLFGSQIPILMPAQAALPFFSGRAQLPLPRLIMPRQLRAAASGAQSVRAAQALGLIPVVMGEAALGWRRLQGRWDLSRPNSRPFKSNLCCICLCPWSWASGKAALLIPCSHVSMHWDCFMRFLYESSEPSCPICRNVVNGVVEIGDGT